MVNVINELLNFFGVNYIPTDFPSFMYWLVSLLAGVFFVRVVLFTVFDFIKNVNEVNKK